MDVEAKLKAENEQRMKLLASQFSMTSFNDNQGKKKFSPGETIQEGEEVVTKEESLP